MDQSDSCDRRSNCALIRFGAEYRVLEIRRDVFPADRLCLHPSRDQYANGNEFTHTDLHRNIHCHGDRNFNSNTDFDRQSDDYEYSHGNRDCDRHGNEHLYGDTDSDIFSATQRSDLGAGLADAGFGSFPFYQRQGQ